jgi:hypothetical protein
MNMEMVQLFNEYVRANVKCSNSVPYGWARCGAHGNVWHYLAHFGVGDIYIDYDVVTNKIVGHKVD